MTLDNKYCAICGQEIKQGVLFGFGGQKSYNFKDGVYCETCAKAKVEKERKKFK